MAMNEDKVNHPSHYALGQYECIDVMIAVFGVTMVMAYCILNAFKYIWRFTRKNGVEDIKKAIQYLQKWVELNEK